MCAGLGAAPARAVEPRAQGPKVDNDYLTWRAPPGCGEAAAIRERVRELLGQREIELTHIKRVEGRVRAGGDGWALTLRLFYAASERERELTSRDCSDLAEAAAVAITLAFEGARSEQSSEHAPSEPATPVDGAQREPAREASRSSELASGVEAESAGTKTERLPLAGRLALGAEAVLDASALPTTAAGASVFGLLGWQEVSLGTFAMWLPSAQQSVGPSQQVDFSLLVLGVRGCYTVGRGLVDTTLCAGLEAGQLSARGSGLAEARTAHDFWMAPQLGLELSMRPAAVLRLQVHAEAVTPLFRQGYAVNDTEDIHHVSSLGVRAGLGVGVDL